MWRIGVVFTALLLLVAPVWADGYTAVTDDGRASVAIVHLRATEVALAVVEDAGNAVDAAVAGALALGVVDGHNSGIGGGIFVIIRWVDGQVEAMDVREVSPAKAHRDMY